MSAAGARLRALSPRARLAAAFGAGLVSALGFEPLNLFFCLLLGLALLACLLDGAAASSRPLRAAFFTGWAFGFGQFLIGLHWIGYPFLVDAAAHGWQMPFAILGMAGGLSLFIAGAAAAAMRFWRPDVTRLVILAIAYGFSEWLRGHVLTGFPWNIAANVWALAPPVMQSVSLFGAYGLSFLTILFGLSLSGLLERPLRLAPPLAMAALFACLFLYGSIRLSAPTQFVPDVLVRLVQPDIPQKEKFDPQFVRRNWQRLLTLSATPSARRPTHIIWPEAAPPFVLAREPVALDQIVLLTGQDRVLMTGAERIAEDADGARRYYNSLYIFGPRGALAGVYDKVHLVPFGEYIPFGAVLNRIGITKLTQGDIGFSPGDGLHSYQVPGAPAAAPLICYEDVFPGAVIGKDRPGWIVVVTNDAWFGPWAGPQQHFLMARMRAIEEGLPVMRVANTGISAAIDAYGRVVGSIELGRMGALDSQLPTALAPTPYGRYGDLGFFLMMAAAFLVNKTFTRKVKKPDTDLK